MSTSSIRKISFGQGVLTVFLLYILSSPTVLFYDDLSWEALFNTLKNSDDFRGWTFAVFLVAIALLAFFVFAALRAAAPEQVCASKIGFIFLHIAAGMGIILFISLCVNYEYSYPFNLGTWLFFGSMVSLIILEVFALKK